VQLVIVGNLEPFSRHYYQAHFTRTGNQWQDTSYGPRSLFLKGRLSSSGVQRTPSVRMATNRQVGNIAFVLGQALKLNLAPMYWRHASHWEYLRDVKSGLAMNARLCVILTLDQYKVAISLSGNPLLQRLCLRRTFFGVMDIHMYCPCVFSWRWGVRLSPYGGFS